MPGTTAAQRTAYLARALDSVRTQGQARAAAAAAFEVSRVAGEIGLILRPALSSELSALRQAPDGAVAGANWSRVRRHIERLDEALPDDRGWGAWFDLADAIRDATPAGATEPPMGPPPGSGRPSPLVFVALALVLALVLVR